MFYDYRKGTTTFRSLALLALSGVCAQVFAVDAVTVDAAGKVGINTPVPEKTLHVTGEMQIDCGTGQRFLYSPSGHIYQDRAGSSCSHFFRNSGGTSFNARTYTGVPSTNTQMASVLFQGWNGTEYVTGAEIRAYAQDQWSATNEGSFLNFYTTPQGSTTITETMRMVDGKVGIGTTAPTAGLTVGREGSDYTNGSYFLVDCQKTAFGGGAVIAGIKCSTADSHDYKLLRVANALGDKFVIRGDGNVGIGITTPTQKLHVDGAIKSDRSGNPSQYVEVSGGNSSCKYIKGYSTGNNQKKLIIINSYGGASTGDNSDILFKIGAEGSEQTIMAMTTDKVGINTDAPKYPLHVKPNGYGVGVFIDKIDNAEGGELVLNGNTRTWHIDNYSGQLRFIRHQGNDSNVSIDQPFYIDDAGVHCKAGAWFDSVFESNYVLKPLSEIERFVAKEKHLPGIPSEKEVKENGINLSGMIALHLQKIEELTLYAIAQDKKIESQEKELAAQKAKNAELESRLAAIEAMLKK